MSKQHQIWIGTRKGLFSLSRVDGRTGPSAWSVDATVHFLGDPVSAVLADPRDGLLYAALNLGHFGVKLRRSSDGGANWQEVSVPAYPSLAASPGNLPEAPAATSGPDASPPKLEQLWILQAGGADQPGVLWAGTIPGGLFRSDDHGDSWTLVDSLWNRPERSAWLGGGYDQPGIHSICVDPRDSRHLTVGVSCGGVWQTHDEGATWQLTAAGMRADYMPPELSGDANIQDPHRVVQCAARPDVLWTQHHNGIFRSTDGAASWYEVTSAAPARFGFAVAVHPQDPDTAWFVPAVKDECRVPVDGQLVVSRTRDGGQTFEVLRQGLPQRHAYDLVYRHGLAVDATGTHLAFGSTTGGVWVSEDQGNAWHVVPARLPPVYCVCFAP